MAAIARVRVEDPRFAVAVLERNEDIDDRFYTDLVSVVSGVCIGALVGQACLEVTPPICRKLFGPERSIQVLKLFVLHPTTVPLRQKIGTLLMTPFMCWQIPMFEEKIFRGLLMDSLEKKIYEKCTQRFHMAEATAHKVAWVASLVLSSLIFGACHITNALVLWCNPIKLLPQAIFTAFFGLAMGILKIEAVQKRILGFCPPAAERLELPIYAHRGTSLFTFSRLIFT